MPEQSATPKSIGLRCPVCQAQFRVPHERTKKYSSAKCARCGSTFKIADALKNTTLSNAEKAYLEATTFDSQNLLGRDSQVASDLFMNPDELASFQKKRRPAPIQDPQKQQEPEAEPDPFPPSTQQQEPKEQTDTEEEDWLGSKTDAEESLDIDDQPEAEPDLFEEEWNELSADGDLDELPSVAEIEEKKKKSSLVTKAFLAVWALMFFGGLGVIAYASLTHPIWLENIYRFFNLSLHEISFSDESTQTYEIHNIHGRRSLYVVEGQLVNQFDTDEKVSWIQVKGVALDENGKMLETSIAFAGNVLTKKELAEQELYQIKKFYKYPNGQGNTNHELKEQQAVPFQIVFYDSSQRLNNVSVKIISYVKNSQTVYPQSISVN